MEDLRRRASRFGLDIVMVNVWEHVRETPEPGSKAAQWPSTPTDEARMFCDIWGLEGTVLIDEDASFIDATAVRGVPFNLLVDEEGIVQAAGFTDPDALHRTVARFAPGVFGE